MSILDDVASPKEWRDYYESKCNGSVKLRETERCALLSFIDEKQYLPLVLAIKRGEMFSLPKKRSINKLGSDKKRIVYSFSEDENRILKLIARLLYRYDSVMSPSLYSFRRNMGVKRAIRELSSVRGIDQMYCLKLDIKDYFNSIDIAILLPVLQQTLLDDPELFSFLKALLTVDAAVENGEIVSCKRGVMAGTPISPFLANLYLCELDSHFDELKVPYARYSDDIIVFAPTEEKLNEYEGYIRSMLEAKQLSVNEKKVFRYAPGDAWEFLGVSYKGGEIDLSQATKNKLKGKLNRKARALFRWKERRGADDERAMRAYIRTVNKKLYDNPTSSETTWALWFFPLITVTDGLKEIDDYIRDNIRFVACGRYRKANYRINHKMLQSMGCRSLVNEFYRFRKEARSITDTNQEE